MPRYRRLRFYNISTVEVLPTASVERSAAILIIPLVKYIMPRQKPHRVTYYLTLTPKTIADLELAAFAQKRATSTTTRIGQIVEQLVKTDAIVLGVKAIESNRDKLHSFALDKWQGATIHGERKRSFGITITPAIHRKLRITASNISTSLSELVEWTIREGGLTVMNQSMQETNSATPD